ncbi:MAG: Carbohydrate family 9 binding domain-like, partial [Bacteroidetes bacterium]|nr:Carbohydrate family 9 binding domain-like [Bacteroidota bacterium]
MRKIASMTLVVLIAGFTAIAQKAQVDIYKTSASPLIDGIEEDAWALVQPIFIDKNFILEIPTVTAYWKAMWKDSSMYLLFHVEDDDHYPSWEALGNQWEYDQIEVYFDVNDILNDGKGPAYSGSGHYQSAPLLAEDGYNILHTEYLSFTDAGGQYAYRLDGENYTYEYMIPFMNFMDQYGYVQFKEDFIDKEIGFDVTVVDQDEDITTGRQRKVWQNDGNPNPGEESWNNMDACGIIIFRDTVANYYANDTVLCDSSKSSAVVFEPPGDPIVSYTWDPDGGTLLFADTLFARIRWNESGNKNVRLFIQTQSGDFDTLERPVIIYPKLSVSLGADFAVCNARTFRITPTIINGNKPFQYFWDYKPGDSVYSGSLNSSKT